MLQIVKKTDVESARGRKRRNPLNDLKREVAIMRTLRHKNIVALQVTHICLPASMKIAQHTPTLHGEICNFVWQETLVFQKLAFLAGHACQPILHQHCTVEPVKLGA